MLKTTITNVAKLAWEWLEEIAHCSTTQNPNIEGVTRLCASPEHAAANKKLAAWMKLSSMTVRMDNAGNLIGRYESSTNKAKTVIFGSHQDTVPHGGKYDGILGVILPIAIINFFHSKNIRFPFHIEVIAFSDEEGTRFQSTLLGSKAIAGGFSPKMLNAIDENGISLNQALIDFGCQPGLIVEQAYQAQNIIGFIELHIEQGPQLENANLPLGIVSDITGIERHQLCIQGKAGHAGTVPMTMRQDSLVGAAQIISMFTELCKSQSNLVGVVGKIENYPNGVNVIPEQTKITLELRSPRNESRLAARKIMKEKIHHILTSLNLSYELSLLYQQNGVACSAKLSDYLATSLTSCGVTPKFLFSGAGHDGLAMHKLTDIAMLFMRCKDGLSHHPNESVEESDLIIALKVLEHFCLLLAKKYLVTDKHAELVK